MPDIARSPLRMDCTGIDLVHPIDRLPQGAFAYLFNVRILQEGRIEGRPGYREFLKLADQPNSVRRLNDPSRTFAPAGYIYVGGGGPSLYAGTESPGDYMPVDNGYSGDPVSLIPFRPDQSPEAWMYAYDKGRMAKVRPDKVMRDIGVAPPPLAPLAEYGPPANVPIDNGQNTAGWIASGVSTGPTLQDRTSASTPGITSIQYIDGPTGWCCINPSITQPFWMGNRMKVVLDPAGGNQETVVVRDVLNAITTTVLDAIQYDVGIDGLCSLVLRGSPVGLSRNSLIQIDAEVVRVLEVIPSPDGISYSVRCATNINHTAGEIVTGLISWFVWTTMSHVAGELIASSYLLLSHSATGVGSAHLTSNINASAAAGRPIDTANDYLHISLFIQDPQVVTNIQLLLSLDIAPNFSFINPGNSWIWTIDKEELNVQGSSAGSWVDIVIPISSGVRSGSDLTRTLATISGIAIQMTSTAATNYGFDWWYLFGTYGPIIQPNSPVGVVYQYRYRDSSTGARSVPGPQTRYELFPLREGVSLTPLQSLQSGVDEIDFYRLGGTVTSPLYIGSTGNDAPPSPLLDSLPDVQVLEINQPPSLDVLQPWPILALPWIGECMVIGTSVIWVRGTKFNTKLISNTVILIDGLAYRTYGQPRSDTFLELTQDAGFLASANFLVASPTLAAQTLPFAFGPLEGPFAPVIFALGDPHNGGLLYWSNFADADGASDRNTVEVETPSTDLVSGAIWNGLCFAGSRETISCIRYSYLTSIGASDNTTYQWARIPAPSGMWSRWACCSCPIGIAYLGKDGIYIATDTAAISITDGTLYPLFPHDGEKAVAVNSGSNIILPVDMTLYKDLRLTYCDESLRFSYVDIGGNFVTLIYEIYKKRWLLNNYHDAISLHYLVEASSIAPADQEILMLSLGTNSIMRSGGASDNGEEIHSIILTPSMDGGDQRAQKLYVDSMTQADGHGTLQLAAAFDNAQFFSPILNINCDGPIRQFLQNIASLTDLTLYKNIGAKFTWTGGPDGPRIYAWETSHFVQPFLSKRMVTQINPFSFPGWKHWRRMFPALISVRPVAFTIQCQDGRTFGPYTIPSTGGRYKILPQMLDHGIKDLAFGLELDGLGFDFAYFPGEFTAELKQWNEDTYILLAVFRA